jgi:hypothetical protein
MSHVHDPYFIRYFALLYPCRIDCLLLLIPSESPHFLYGMMVKFGEHCNCIWTFLKCINCKNLLPTYLLIRIFRNVQNNVYFKIFSPRWFWWWTGHATHNLKIKNFLVPKILFKLTFSVSLLNTFLLNSPVMLHCLQWHESYTLSCLMLLHVLSFLSLFSLLSH